MRITGKPDRTSIQIGSHTACAPEELFASERGAIAYSGTTVTAGGLRISLGVVRSRRHTKMVVIAMGFNDRP